MTTPTTTAAPTIHTTYEIVTPESLELGDAEERGFVFSGGWHCAVEEYDRAEDGYAVEALDDDETTVDVAVMFLQHGGGFETDGEAAPETYRSPEYDENFATGARESRSYHLEGFSEQELVAIAARMRA